MSFEFSVVISTNNSELGIEKSINSIITQTCGFENIEIIIVDHDSEDNTPNICENYIQKYPNNIKYFQFETENSAESLNKGLKNSSGKFITFLEPHDYYSKYTFQNVSRFIEKNEDCDLITVPIKFFKNNKYWNYLNYKIKKTEKINLQDQPEYAQILGLSTFAKKDSANNIEFLNTANNKITFFSEILINNPKLGIIKDGTYFSNNIDEKIYAYKHSQFCKNDLENFIGCNFNNLIEKSLKIYSTVPQFIQFNLINHLRWVLAIEKTPEMLDLTELTKNIQHVDYELILNNRLMKPEQKMVTLLLKSNGQLNETQREKLDFNTVFIDTYDIIKDELNILCSTFSNASIDLLVNGKKVNKTDRTFPQKDIYCLNRRFVKNYSFETTISLDIDEKFKIEFMKNNEKLHINFSRPCNFSKTVGYAKTKHYLSILDEDSIVIENRTTFKWIKQELKSLIHIVKQHETGYTKAIPFRIAYMVGYPFLKNKRIWFYMDRPNESDDNGLALFKYSMKQKDRDIDKYFILDSNNKYYNDIKKIGKVLDYKSIKHRYLGLFAENIISSHPDNEIIYPFWGSYPFFAGLLKSNNIFLQHGILKDDISSWLNKCNMNLSFFLVSSTKEYESIFKFPYNYDENVVQLLGLPRYDTLKNQENKKQIIIMPSWRRDLDHKSKEYVKKNEFFKKFNSLINNEKLIEKAKEKNYEIIFRPHPKVYEFIDLFDENDFVKIDYDKVKYQTLFNNGSIMITDYSSVAFDFAYLNKPVLYYHYGEDYHFDLNDSYFDYETMGFGEIARTEEELINLVIEYVENDCMMKDKYSKRIKEFFFFNDTNNCKRVHDKIKEIPLKD